MSKWKYFTDEEVAGLKDELVLKLDQLRFHAQIPVIITCGYRSPEQNLTVGGVANSAHTRGLAVDIACPDSGTRYRLIGAAFQVGFKRIEAATRHVHLDIDETLPQDVLWIDLSK